MIGGRAIYLQKLHLCPCSPTERQYTFTHSLCSSCKFGSKLCFQEADLWWGCTELESCCFYFANQGGFRGQSLQWSHFIHPSLLAVCQTAQKQVGSPLVKNQTGIWHCRDTKLTASSIISSMKKGGAVGYMKWSHRLCSSALAKRHCLFLRLKVSQLHVFQFCFQLRLFVILEWSLSLNSVIFSFMILSITKGKGNPCYNLNSSEQGLQVFRASN